MSNKVQIHQFDPVLYPYKFWVMVTDNLSLISDNFTERDGSPITFTSNLGTYEAITLDIRKKGVNNNYYGALMLFSSKNNMNIKHITHESSHASKRCFEHIGANVAEHEPFEYLLGWVAECVYKVKNYKHKDEGEKK